MGRGKNRHKNKVLQTVELFYLFPHTLSNAKQMLFSRGLNFSTEYGAHRATGYIYTDLDIDIMDTLELLYQKKFHSIDDL